MNTNYTYVLVHGLSGWGSYDKRYEKVPYWGMFGGDLIAYLEKQGITAVAASVAPQGSAWDRACELYAQLTGTKVDYGEAHSKAMGHPRYGEDYSGRPLINKFDAENKINLVGHSFGGATIRLFAEILANGSKEEMDATGDNSSDFFKGGKADYIYSLTTLAAPHNGTTAYLVAEDLSNDPNPPTGIYGLIENKLNGVISESTVIKKDGSKDFSDYADYDMDIDNAMALNKKISTLPNVYYFSYAASSTEKLSDGTYTPENKITEIVFRKASRAMGAYKAATKGGVVLDETWFENDGLVNTISAKAPSSSPSKEFDKNDIKKGVWNIMPTYRGDHMSMNGGLFKKHDIKPLFTEIIFMINEL